MAERIPALKLKRLKDQGSENDLAGTTPAERISIVWPLTLEVWSFKEQTDAESRLARHIVHLRRRAG
jgi:hypothetical protein